MENEAKSTLERRVTRVPICFSALGHHFQGYQPRRSSRRSRGKDQGLSELVPPIFTERSHSGSWCSSCLCGSPRKLPNEAMREASDGARTALSARTKGDGRCIQHMRGVSADWRRRQHWV